MAVRKYVSEFGLNMFASPLVLLQQENFDYVEHIDGEFHVYLIGRRPRITIDPSSFTVTADRVVGTFRKQVGPNHVDIPFNVPNHMGRHDLTLATSFPYTEMALVDASGEPFQRGKCALFMGLLGSEFQEHLDLEILYVGQAYGQEGERTAVDRLKSHSTLQGIYAEAMRNAPDQDIWIVLLGFEPLVIASFDGRTKEQSVSEEEDKEHIHNVVKAVWTGEGMTEQQRVNFIEAALIKYFAPAYNTIYKDSFPNPAHKTYKECYDIDLNMVCVEVNTEELHLRLWSPTKPAEWIHFCQFALHSREERVYMFEP